MTKKGQMPAHIQPKTFCHPQPGLRLIQILEKIPDPRKPSCNFQYSLTSIVFIVIVTTLCGADDWPVIADVAESMKPWIAQFVDLSSGTLRDASRRFANLPKLTFVFQSEEPILWAQIESLASEKKAKSYDKAIELVTDLRDLAARTGASDFHLKLKNLRKKHSLKSSFIERLRIFS
jgi:hypothetical protein